MRWIVLAVALSMEPICPATATAQSVCPWLTEGTAAAALGGPVKATITLDAAGRGSCSFLLQPGTAIAKLLIDVSSSPHNVCLATSSKVQVSGADTLACTSSPIKGEIESRISGRVRATFFTVTLARQSTDTLRQSTLEEVAEQVAGSLY